MPMASEEPTQPGLDPTLKARSENGLGADEDSLLEPYRQLDDRTLRGAASLPDEPTVIHERPSLAAEVTTVGEVPLSERPLDEPS